MLDAPAMSRTVALSHCRADFEPKTVGLVALSLVLIARLVVCEQDQPACVSKISKLV